VAGNLLSRTCNHCASQKKKKKTDNPVAQWPPQYGKSELDQIFRTVGNVVKSELPASNGSDNMGYGMVVYSTEDEAKNAVAQFNG
jgi:RNA recognition motif. (a.k.a. RRM, RBD, or RNP domain)